MKRKLTIGWLYPDLMGIYGDRGNIIVLRKRCEWRGILVSVVPITKESSIKDLRQVDILFGGGAQDSQQTIVSEDLKKGKGEALRDMVEDAVPGLYICGAYQFLGKYYKEADGTIIEGLGIFDLYTINPGEESKRLIGNVIADVSEELARGNTKTIVGFENHGGRTYLGKNIAPLATVSYGNGNNGEDKTEGAYYKNSLGSYFHGPILPKNPHLADYLIKAALGKKYKYSGDLISLDDTLAINARNAIIKRMNQ